MVGEDFEYIVKLTQRGLLRSPCLEVGAVYSDSAFKKFLTSTGIQHYGADLTPHEGIDFVLDFEDSKLVRETLKGRKFKAVLLLNVLEHVLNPTGLLDNAVDVLERGGICVIVAPVIWPLHRFPIDCWRVNPDFYMTYVRNRPLRIIEEYFEYLGYGSVKDYLTPEGYRLPRASTSPIKQFWSSVVHKVFNTTGRSQLFPSHLSIGIVLEKQ